MATEQIKEFMRRFLNASVGQDANAFMELMAPDFVVHVGLSPKNRAETPGQPVANLLELQKEGLLTYQVQPEESLLANNIYAITARAIAVEKHRQKSRYRLSNRVDLGAAGCTGG